MAGESSGCGGCGLGTEGGTAYVTFASRASVRRTAVEGPQCVEPGVSSGVAMLTSFIGLGHGLRI